MTIAFIIFSFGFGIYVGFKTCALGMAAHMTKNCTDEQIKGIFPDA